MTLPFFTIGHSNRGLETFVAMLRQAEVARVVDIRKMPRSRTNPQFNETVLPQSLADFGIGYDHMASLGGLRGKTAAMAPQINGFWTNRSFHNYADYALTEPFQAGLAHLLEMGREQRCTVMCSEAVWWRCHRRIVADYLIANGRAVFHIMGEGRLVPARLTPGAVVQTGGRIVYPGPAPGP